MTKRRYTSVPDDDDAVKVERGDDSERWRRFVWVPDEIKPIDAEPTGEPDEEAP